MHNVVEVDVVDNLFLFWCMCMIGLRKTCIQLGIIALVAGVSFSHTRVFAATTPVETYMAGLVSTHFIETNPTTVSEIINTYCTTVLSTSGFIQNGFVYNANQSAFVYLLCKNAWGNAATYFKNKEDNIFLRKDFDELGFEDVVDGNDLCTPMSNDCDIATLVPNLFDDIIMDYVNMKQANFYGLIWNFTGDAWMESQINTFSHAYFGNDVDICEPKDPRYPSTCHVMKWYLKNARNLLSDVRIFNASWILAMVLPMAQQDANANRDPAKFKANPKLWSCTEVSLDKDIFLCGLYGDTAGWLVAFTNLTYNELFYYRFFMGYYFLMLQKNPSILLNNTWNTDINTLIKKSSNQYFRSKDALSLTFRMMRDTYMAYPFHIGLLMYQEDLWWFGKLLAKIATPIYTLYDKLRNVQTK